MARLMSQIKGGYYAAAPEAVAAVLERLQPAAPGSAWRPAALVLMVLGVGWMVHGRCLTHILDRRCVADRAKRPVSRALAFHCEPRVVGWFISQRNQ